MYYDVTSVGFNIHQRKQLSHTSQSAHRTNNDIRWL